METSTNLIDKINRYISSLDYYRQPEGLYDPIQYALSLGGKRFRPALMLMAANLWQDEVDGLLPSAAGLEIYHNFTLLHDDLMDKADRRRGHATVHRKWNPNTAILSGDTMLILAFRYFVQTQSQRMPEMLSAFHTAALEVCEGQQYDVEFETMENVSEESYLHMIRLKTSVLVAAALKIGALYAGSTEQEAQRLYDFGLYTGIAFQLRDDYLDVYGDPQTFGKNLGGDILSNKKTWMLIKALELGDESQVIQLQGWLNRIDFLAEEKIAAVTELYNQVGIGPLALDKIEEYYKKGLDCLDQVAVPEERKSVLRQFAEDLLNRSK